MKILVIDNYDSFVYNLVHYLEDLDCEVTVRRNDEVSLEEVADFDKILLSPGPGIPEQAGLLKAIILRAGHSKPILGVCLGHQAIGEVFGAKLENLDHIFHGVSTPVKIICNNEPIFKGLPLEIEVGRYHSWGLSKIGFPQILEITSEDEWGQIMSFRHKNLDIKGVQFHPESVLTIHGKQIIRNWVES